MCNTKNILIMKEVKEKNFETLKLLENLMSQTKKVEKCLVIKQNGNKKK